MNTHVVELTPTEKELLETLANPRAVVNMDHARVTAGGILSKTKEVKEDGTKDTVDDGPISSRFKQEPVDGKATVPLGKNIGECFRTGGD